MVRLLSNGDNPGASAPARQSATPTKVLVLRDGQVYFEGQAIDLVAFIRRLFERVSSIRSMSTVSGSKATEEAKRWRNASN